MLVVRRVRPPIVDGAGEAVRNGEGDGLRLPRGISSDNADAASGECLFSCGRNEKYRDWNDGGARAYTMAEQGQYKSVQAV
jgi:hypothetical protein